MTTSEDMAARQTAQRAESNGREIPADDQGNRAPDPRVDLTPENTGAGEDEIQGGGEANDAPRGVERTKPLYMSPSDEMRARIAKRFKRDEEGEVPFNGNPNDPEMMYGKFGRAPDEPQDEPQGEPQPAAQPRMITLKVRGRDVTKSEDEWLADAAKVTAADSYLEDGRKLLEGAQAINRDRNNRERGPADPQHPEGRANTQDDHTDQSLSADPQHPEDELEGAIEEVRYGTDSKEAAQKLRSVISKEADKAADERQLKRLLANDTAKSSKALRSFIEANPDLANDEIASQVMEQQLYAIQREELVKMGIDESKLPKNFRVLAQWHQFQRVHGHPVSTPEDMLKQAQDRFSRWKGGSRQQQPQPQPRKESPRIEVNVNRDVRRAQLPNQPTRSTTPPPPLQRPSNGPPQASQRSDIIMKMRQQRGQVIA